MNFLVENNNISVDVNFNKGINFLIGSSGSGKTFLLKSIVLFCKLKNISYVKIDYTSDLNEDIILLSCKEKEVILLDNADLYLSPNMYNKIKSLNSIVIISKKKISNLSCNDTKMYVVHYRDKHLSIEEA